jgi:hypothetical protein
MLVLQDSVRFKQKSTDHLYDAMLTGEDSVLVRPASPYPLDMYVLTLEVFCQNFEEYWGPQTD